MTDTPDDYKNDELEHARNSFIKVVEEVLGAAQAAGVTITAEQKAATLAHCIVDDGFMLACTILDFAERIGVPMSENMIVALASNFDCYANPPSPKDPQQKRPQRRAFRPSVVKPNGAREEHS